MDISSVNITSLLPELNATGRSPAVNNAVNGNANGETFESLMNDILTKELLKPIFSSGLFTADQQYSYIMQDALTQHFKENYQLFSLDTGETSK